MDSVVIDPYMSYADVLKALPQDELDELNELGDSRDAARWRIGEILRHWIDDCHMPAMHLYKIVADRTDYGADRVRQFCSTVRFYYERPELQAKYAVLKFSIFEHASKCADAETALKMALEGQLTPTLIKFTSPTLTDDLTQTYQRASKRHPREARSIMETALAKLKELTE